MKIGVIAGGGDCPGLNAVIQAIVTRAFEYGYTVLGVLNGYAGLINGDIKPLSLDYVDGIYEVGGIIIGTSRTNPFKIEDGPRKVMETIKKFGINALIAIGGEDTLGVASNLIKMGVPAVGVPKTIDNDVSATDYSIGFQTAVSTATEAISRLHTTAKSHQRVIVVEVMGRHAGWMTLMAGLAGGAHVILLPEQSFDVQEVCDVINKREAKGKKHSIVAVAEGAKPKHIEDLVTVSTEKDAFGHVRLGGIAGVLEKAIAKRTGKETRSVVLGHVQRGGSPGAFDRVLGIRLGLYAVDLIKQKKFGHAAVLHGTKILAVKLEDATKELKTVGEDLFELTKFFSVT
jgi:phosphofructokinase-like protein